MANELNISLLNNELAALSLIVHVGDATYRDLMETQRPMFGHQYFSDTRGRIRTKLVQMQCELESRNPNFPFEFRQREFSYNQFIPELRTKNVIIHIGRSPAPDILPYPSKYKCNLSYNNESIRRQLILDYDNNPPYGLEPYYGILVFGGRDETFSIIQFPEPGYTGIADSIEIPSVYMIPNSAESENLERKKSNLKEEFLAHIEKEDIS